jgi:putative transposase
MARPSRELILGSGQADVHLTARAHNGEFLFEDERVKFFLYCLLLLYKKSYGVLVYHYCFMDNHVHLILFAASTEMLSKFLQRVFSQLARFINFRCGRKGEVFMDRARTPVIQCGRHFLCTMRYIDKNPQRAGMVKKPKDYGWSSYRYYAYGEHDDLIDPAPEYLGLSPNPLVRRKMYRELVNVLLGRGEERLPEMTNWFFIGDPDWVFGNLKRIGMIRPRKPPGLFGS